MATLAYTQDAVAPRTHRILRDPRLDYLLLSTWCAFLFFYGLNSGELYRTESLRAILGAEFLHSGNWITPRLYGEPMLTKPPLAYATIALAGWPFGGVTAWSARLPSAAAATLVVFLLYWTFRRCTGRLGGLIATAATPASMLWLDRAPSAEIDMQQVAWVAGALLCFLRAVEYGESSDQTKGRRAEWLWHQAALLCVAGGALTKWTAPAFFYLAAVPFLLWRKRLPLLWSWPHLLSVLVAMLPCIGWAAAVAHQVGWEPLIDTVRREALQHLSPLHHARPYPWSEIIGFPLLFFAANLPWSLAALFSLRPKFTALWDERGRRLLQLMHCWAWPNLLFWSLVPGHHIRHGLPLQPAMAGLAALVWIAWLTGRLRWPVRRVRPAYLFAGLVVAWLTVKVVFEQTVIPGRDVGRSPQTTAERIAAVVPDGNVLYLCDLKDEGILFYYGRPALRVDKLDDLFKTDAPQYCILTAAEWKERPTPVLLRLVDEQGGPIVLTRIDANSAIEQSASAK